MKTALIFAPMLALAALLPATAFSASSEWTKVEGGAVRVVIAGLPDQNGVLRGALEIKLKPGWKTYWRDPGDAGIPPMVSVEQAEGSVEMDFPAPHRFDDGYSIWAGYKEPVALPLTFQLGSGVSKVDLSVFLGICEEICIPVQADYSIDLESSHEAAVDKETVEAAFRALPGYASEEFEASLTSADADRLLVDVQLPEGSADPELFVASTENWLLGTPEPISGKSGSYRIPVLVAPDSPSKKIASFHYTLVGSGKAVSGTFELIR